MTIFKNNYTCIQIPAKLLSREFFGAHNLHFHSKLFHYTGWKITSPHGRVFMYPPGKLTKEYSMNHLIPCGGLVSFWDNVINLDVMVTFFEE